MTGPAAGNPRIGGPAAGNPRIGGPAAGNPRIGGPAAGNPRSAGKPAVSLGDINSPPCGPYRMGAFPYDPRCYLCERGSVM